MSDQDVTYPDVAPAIVEDQDAPAPLDFDIGVGGDRWRNFRQDVLVPVPVQGGDSYSADIGQIVNPDGSILDLSNFLRTIGSLSIGVQVGFAVLNWFNPASPVSGSTVILTPGPYQILHVLALTADPAVSTIIAATSVSQPPPNGSLAFQGRDATGAAHGTGYQIGFSYAIFLDVS